MLIGRNEEFISRKLAAAKAWKEAATKAYKAANEAAFLWKQAANEVSQCAEHAEYCAKCISERSIGTESDRLAVKKSAEYASYAKFAAHSVSDPEILASENNGPSDGSPTGVVVDELMEAINKHVSDAITLEHVPSDYEL